MLSNVLVAMKKCVRDCIVVGQYERCVESGVPGWRLIEATGSGGSVFQDVWQRSLDNRMTIFEVIRSGIAYLERSKGTM